MMRTHALGLMFHAERAESLYLAGFGHEEHTSPEEQQLEVTAWLKAWNICRLVW